MEGRWGGEKGRVVGREERGGSEQHSSVSPSKGFVPSRDIGFLCGEKERKEGVHGGRRKDGDIRQGESMERKERCTFFYFFPLSPSLCTSLKTCMHLPFIQRAVLR